MNGELFRLERALLLLAMVAAFGFRLAHLGGPMDVPDWRQADTAYMVLRMFEESPPDMLRPKAPYRGSKDVKAAEYPIYPLSAALAWKAIGRESLPAARAVTLAYFTGALLYLFGFCRILFGSRVAWYAAVIYSALPLSVVYSRMIHPDFAILFFCHGFLYHALRFYRDHRWAHYAAAIVMASGAFLMKAPYCFYLGLPLLAYVLGRKEGWTLRNLATLGFVFVVPLALAVWFNHHRLALEAAETESLLYPMKWTTEGINHRYFGKLAQRLDPSLWMKIGKRGLILAATPLGGLAAALGVLCFVRRRAMRSFLAFMGIVGGVLLYTLLVMPMVASNHEYYSLPFMLPVAIGAGALCGRLVAGPAAAAFGKAAILRLVVVLALLWGGTAYGLHRGPYLYGGPYFQPDWQRLRAGEVMRSHTGKQDLVVSVTRGRSTGWSDPRILYHAHRLGWSIEWSDLTPAALDTFRSGGARWVALLTTPAHPPDPSSFGPLSGRAYSVHPLQHPESGEGIGHLVLFDLTQEAGS